MAEWEECKLGDVVKVKNGFAFKSEDFIEEGVPVIKIKNVKPNKILLDTLSYVSPEVAKGKDNYLIEPNDILITMSGNRADGSPDSWVGKVSQFRMVGTYLLNQRVSIIQVKEEKASIPFIAYNLSSWQTQLYLISHANSSGGQANISPDLVKGIALELPPLTEQKAIASVLSSLDDKIDLLHRQNKTLEAMAETLFRQWFVEEAQEDWEEGKLGDLAMNPKDGVKPSDIDHETKYIGLEHIDRRSIALIQSGTASDVTSNKFLFSEDDILFGKLRPYFHKVCFAPYSGVCSTDILVIRPKKPYYFAYCLFAFYQSDVVEYANLGSGGTRMPRTNWEALSQYPVVVPDDMRLCDFNNLIAPSTNKIKENISQIRTIEKLRDTLLPKLMSGEVRVEI